MSAEMMKYKNRSTRLSGMMLQKLIEFARAYDRDPDMPVCIEVSSTIGSLYHMGILEIKNFIIEGKEILGFYLTEKGLSYLKT